MQMTVERDGFLRAVSAALGALDSKSEVPIFSHLLIGLDGEAGFVRGTDQDLEISAPFEAQIVSPGALAVPGKLIHDIVKRMPGKARIALTIAQEKLKIVCGNSRFHLAILGDDDYPALQSSAQAEAMFEIEADRLRAMLAGVRHAIAADESRPYLGGIYLHVTKESPARLKAVATNGHMLALQASEAPPLAETMPAIILPRRTVNEFLKALPTGTELVSLGVSERLITLALAGGWRLTSRLIDGVYPDYRRVIPSDNPHRALVKADLLAAAIDRVATLCDPQNGIALSLTPGGPIGVAVERQAIGSGHDEAAAEITGRPARIGLNPRYMAAILASLSGGMVELQYNSPADPVLIRPQGSADVLNVLMPMRLAEGTRLDEAA
jgi:DNA polymerase-3 subunit beta